MTLVARLEAVLQRIWYSLSALTIFYTRWGSRLRDTLLLRNRTPATSSPAGRLDALLRDALLLRTRLPVILQTEAAECGLACLAMISIFYGGGEDLGALRRRFPISVKGINLGTLIDLADRLGFAARPVRLEIGELSLLKTPCILHWDLNHFVVLASASPDRVVIHDPASGLLRSSPDRVSKHFTGVALEVSPLSIFRSAESPPRVSFRSVLGRIAGLRHALGRLLVLAFAIEVLAVASPFFLQWVVDQALVAGDRDLLATLAIGFGLLLLLRTAVGAMRGWSALELGASLKVQSRANLFSHLVGLPTSYFEARHLGDVMSRFASQKTILQAITTDLIEVMLDGLFAFVTLTLMFVFAPGLAVLVVGATALYALLRIVCYPPLRRVSSEAIVWGARRDSHFLETLRGIRTVKLFNAQEGRRALWLNLVVESVNRQLTAQSLRLVFQTVNNLLIGGLAILVLWLGAYRVLDNIMTVGMLLAFIAYKDQFVGRIAKLIDKAVDLTMLRLHAERLADVALTAPEPRDAALVVEKIASPVGLEVRDLRFRYAEHEPWVVDRLSFKIEPGESVAIVGASGCGKTTLLKLLASLLSPTEGSILVDGEPLQRFGIQRWRSLIGVVMQDDQLFAGSLADNIAFFDSRPDLERIEQCARLAAVHDEILAMPMGYNTLIGDMGMVLSGGQKQRVLLARALYRQPRLLLLDEATSHLDVEAEKAVNAAVRATQVTRIIIAHRPETIRSADRIIRLDRQDHRDLPPRGPASLVQVWPRAISRVDATAPSEP